jgi:hypothetical protein
MIKLAHKEELLDCLRIDHQSHSFKPQHLLLLLFHLSSHHFAIKQLTMISAEFNFPSLLHFFDWY